MLISLGFVLLAAVSTMPSSVSTLAMASQAICYLKNEARYQAFKFASIEGRDMSAIRADMIGLADHNQERSLLESDRNGLADRLRREAHFVSRRHIETKFGSSPRLVRFEVDFGNGGERGYFVAKMAGPSLMPHSVATFLGQIESGYWNGRAFDLNTGHMLVASGLFSSESNNDVVSTQLKERGLASPIFGEYSPLHPHLEMTLGFVANRPTPHFYINTRDNEDVHGHRSGQRHNVGSGDADPCFAQIVAGRDTIERMMKQIPDFRLDQKSSLKTSVTIVRADIVR